jgi:outer membrane protein assembly factor BamB
MVVNVVRWGGWSCRNVLAVCLMLGIVMAGAAGCGGHRASQTTSTVSRPTVRHPAPPRRARLRHVRVSVLDGDTGQTIHDARIAARGASVRGRVVIARHDGRRLQLTASAPLYAARTVELGPTDDSATVTLFRPDGQWPMYGATPTRTQFQPAIHLRPPFRVVWGRNLGSLIEFPAVVYDGVAYLTNFGGRLFALSMKDGQTVWERDLKTRPQASSPAIVGSDLIVHAMDGRIFVVDRSSGRIRWSRPTSGRIESSPVVVDGVDYLGDWAGDIYAFDLGKRAPRWVYHDGCKITSSVAVSAGTLYVGDYCGRVIALSRKTGRLLWSAQAGSPIYGTVAVADGRVFAPSRDAGALYAFTTSGRYLWHVSSGGLVYSAPAVWRGRVFFGSYTGELYCVSAASGRVLWSFNAGGSISGALTTLDGVVYAGTFSHRIVGVDASTGRQVFSFPHGEYVPVSGNRGRLLLYGWASLWAVEAKRPAVGS